MMVESSLVTYCLGQLPDKLPDRGFVIQGLSASPGITLNWPKQKENDQFMEVDVATNFDIAVTRIHVERFVGRVTWVF